ncbi:MAG: fluoride efflux transporter CrcB [Bacteroidota bacterium]|nr:fluoride efflux transporter CrcB [Bacteroidota bacterium]MDP4232793.1 fluoride efflux transporter CrcB [Bacteroidota bacterium]MDP4242526.1 fluoride efflux transporter CrcB [Bacteroidota bacterium]MDP4288895.1 fluoride efflux transporter CrcB [Bacteroidota bacterium]
MFSLRTLAFLAVGAVCGTTGRYAIGMWLSRWSFAPPDFPWPTFIINVTGSLLLGFLMRYLTGVASTPHVRLMLTTGFCGAYTTMSTFSYEFISLMTERQYLTAAFYMGGTMVLAPAACMVGFAVAEAIL